jgi:hypothetical protein
MSAFSARRPANIGAITVGSAPVRSAIDTSIRQAFNSTLRMCRNQGSPAIAKTRMLTWWRAAIASIRDIVTPCLSTLCVNARTGAITALSSAAHSPYLRQGGHTVLFLPPPHFALLQRIVFLNLVLCDLVFKASQPIFIPGLASERRRKTAWITLCAHMQAPERR